MVKKTITQISISEKTNQQIEYLISVGFLKKQNVEDFFAETIETIHSRVHDDSSSIEAKKFRITKDQMENHDKFWDLFDVLLKSKAPNNKDQTLPKK